MATIDFTKLSDRTFYATVEPDHVNIGLVIGDDGALLIDTGSTPEQGSEIRAAAETLAKKPITHVAVTHGHRDHCLGLAAFSDCQTYAHSSAKNWPSDEVLLADAKKLGVAEIVVPNQLFTMITAFDLGNQRIELVHGGPGHSPSDIVIICPQEDVIFVGDLWEESAPPSYGPDTNVIEWPKTLDTVMGAFGENSKVVVGHGKPVTRHWALEERMKIGAIPAIVEWLIVKNIPIESGYQGTPEWPWPREVIEQILPIAYPQLASRAAKWRRNLPIAR